MKTKEKIFEVLRQEFENSIQRNQAQGILFSGGLDTCIVAALCSDLPCINVQLENNSTDLTIALKAKDKFNLNIDFVKVTNEQALEAVDDVVRILESFDPAIPNDLAVYFGLQKAKQLNINSLLTGDGSDELFAGYDYMQKADNLKEYIKYLSTYMIFNSNRLGDFFEISIKQPFIDKKIIDIVIEKLDKEMLINFHKDKLFGKWILREVFEDVLGEDLAWQSKRPLEIGSGMRGLRKVISDKITDEEFEDKKKLYNMDFYCKDHLYYYEVYRKVIGDIPKASKDQEECPNCKAGAKKGSMHCYTCGWVKKYV